MPFSQKIFDQAIWGIVSRINAGHIMSYGSIARAAGFPRHARMVSKAMCRSTASLPWYRVVKSDRTIAFAVDSDEYKEQKNLLEKEGTQVINGKVIPLITDEMIDLDKLLWGPSDL